MIIRSTLLIIPVFLAGICLATFDLQKVVSQMNELSEPFVPRVSRSVWEKTPSPVAKSWGIGHVHPVLIASGLLLSSLWVLLVFSEDAKREDEAAILDEASPETS